MKCPKCGYLGFEPVDRCRNCGYDFSLSSSVPLPDLSIRTGPEDERPLDDLSLLDAATAGDAAMGADDLSANPGADLDRLFAPSPLDGAPPTPASPLPARTPRVAESAPSSELPLFGGALDDDDRPLITRVSPPRTPLAVRRSTPEAHRLRGDGPRMHSLDLALEVDEPKVTPPPAVTAPSPPANEDASRGARLAAAAIDVGVLAMVDALVIYFTMSICGLGLAELSVLPKGPLLAFLILQNVGYLVAFTAGGQTLGKIALGIKVMATGSPASPDLGRALVREAIWLLLAVPAGLGFLTVLAADHRGLHDRLAGTRVVR